MWVWMRRSWLILAVCIPYIVFRVYLFSHFLVQSSTATFQTPRPTTQRPTSFVEQSPALDSPLLLGPSDLAKTDRYILKLKRATVCFVFLLLFCTPAHGLDLFHSVVCSQPCSLFDEAN